MTCYVCASATCTDECSPQIENTKMNQHTPGPWRYKPHRIDSNYMLIYCSSESSEGDNLRGYCGEANARLIAAAPDLLDALTQTLLALEAIGQEMTVGERYTDAGQYLIDSLNPARAAILKATGKSNEQ